MTLHGKREWMHLYVLFAVDIHSHIRAEPDQTLPHFHVALPTEEKDNLSHS